MEKNEANTTEAIIPVTENRISLLYFRAVAPPDRLENPHVNDTCADSLVFT